MASTPRLAGLEVEPDGPDTWMETWVEHELDMNLAADVGIKSDGKPVGGRPVHHLSDDLNCFGIRCLHSARLGENA